MTELDSAPSPSWLERQFAPAAAVVVCFSTALAYLAMVRGSGDALRSVFGLGAAFAPPIFIGIVAGIGRPQAPVRHALILTGIALLAVAPLFGEAFFCVIMLSPLYLGTTPLVALLARAIFRRVSRRSARVAALLLPWALFAADRPVPVRELPVSTVSDAVELAAPPAAVWAAIDRLDMTFPQPDAAFARWGLPIPRALHGQGAHVGAERRLLFHNGTLVARVTASEAPRRFSLALSYEDAGREFFDHWVVLEDTEFVLEPLPGGRTRLVHTTHYRRLVRPRVWFPVVERYGSHLLQGYLLRAFSLQRFAVEPAPAVASR